ncbi:MAG: GAF domain-containing protein [Burkholderiales bacterium]|nr:GAF domain-containing protein [Burkholderiales bacterium]
MLRAPEPQAPAFGEADLSNCEREQIHLAGSIQPHGALLVVREPDLAIVQASANAAAFLGLEGALVGRTLGDLGGSLARCMRPHLAEPLGEIPVAVRCRAGTPPAAFDCLLHRVQGAGLVVELERAGPPVDLSKHVEAAIHRLVGCPSLRALAEEAAAAFKDLTGYDRVMVYRFDEDGHGEVFAERREPRLEPFLGNRYPASDIPQIARRLYERNRVRVLADVAYAPVPLEPRVSPLTGAELDMSLCFLRSMSPIHIQYLKNMGVGATLVVSLVVGGKLWGLVACHHYAPRFVHYEVRTVCELLAETIATRIAALESFAQAHAELSVRRLEQRMAEAISRDGDWRAALFDRTQALLQPLEATGAALLFEGEILTAGEVPGTQALRELGRWLDERPRAPVFATASLGRDEPRFAALTPVASGLLATPVSNMPGEYILWFRPERVRTVVWGGDPTKPVVVGDSPADLSPRRSFAKWHQVVEGTADPWGPAELAAARLIGESVADIVIQFRSVRMLIADDQLAQVSRQVGESEQPVLVADAGGRILVASKAFDSLVGARPPRSLEELPALFADRDEARASCATLLGHRHPWRVEAALAATAKPVLVRADPIFAGPGRVLGFVVVLTDLSERKAAEVARRRFQEQIVAGHRPLSARLDSSAGLLYRNLLSAVVENAQLAALEIADGTDPGAMPAMLEAVRRSVARSAEMLEHLVEHASRVAGEGEAKS